MTRPLLDLYVPRDSLLHRLDSRAKLLLGLAGVVSGLLLAGPGPLAAHLALVHGLLLGARVPGSRLRWMWRQLLPLNLIILVLWPLFDPSAGRLLLELGPLRVTEEGLLAGLAAALRVNGLAFWTLLPVFTTSQAEIVRGLVGLRVPYGLALTLGLALRFLPTIYGLYEGVRDAQQARGWRPRGGLQRLRDMGPQLVATIVAAVRLAERLSLALVVRGAGSGVLYRPDRRLDPADLAAVAAGVGLVAVSLLARWTGLGR